MNDTTQQTKGYPRATDFSTVALLDDAVNNIGADGNIGALLVEMAQSDVIAVMYVAEADRDKSHIPFNPLILGDDDFNYMPFFDRREAYQAWVSQYPESSQACVAPVVFHGSVLFPALSRSDNLNVVLNPNSDSYQVIYHGNLVWIKNQVDALQRQPEMKVMSNMSATMPSYANEALLKTDLATYLDQAPEVNAAYLFSVESFDRETNISVRYAMIMIESDHALLPGHIEKLEKAFEFNPEKYGLEKDYSISFMAVPNTEAGSALVNASAPFYKKEI